MPENGEGASRQWLEVSVKRAFEHFGLEIRRSAEPPWRPPDASFSAGTILDVGAADGTPALYRAYPEARIVAVDPIAEQLARLQASLSGRPVEVFETALGSEPAVLELHMPERNLHKSSLHARTALTADRGKSEARQVPVTTLDELVGSNDWPAPYVLKIDTEGHDLEVLRGSVVTLRQCAVVYCETSLGARFESGYRFRDLSEFLFAAGFDLVDVLHIGRGITRHASYVDCVWVPRTAPTKGY